MAASAMVADFKVELIARLSGNERMRLGADGCARPRNILQRSETKVGSINDTDRPSQ